MFGYLGPPVSFYAPEACCVLESASSSLMSMHRMSHRITRGFRVTCLHPRRTDYRSSVFGPTRSEARGRREIQQRVQHRPKERGRQSLRRPVRWPWHPTQRRIQTIDVGNAPDSLAVSGSVRRPGSGRTRYGVRRRSDLEGPTTSSTRRARHCHQRRRGGSHRRRHY
jgi:hypothetical protein